MTIGKAYEKTKIEVQECSGNRPPVKDSIKAIAHGFSHNPAPPGEQSTESERSKIIFKTQRSIKEV